MSAPDEARVIDVRQIQAYVPVSVEMLLDSGAITMEQALEMGWTPPPPAPPIPWPRRARWALWRWRVKVGRRAGSWIAGVELGERDDWECE